jgi:hypothetical protein
MDRFEEAIARIDAANAEDPHLVDVDGAAVPHELRYAQLMTAWLERLEPDASEELRIAARAQHIRRWEVPRATWPEGREGYKRWRKDLAKRHAELTGRILRDVGYGEETVQRVATMLQKKQLKVDPEVQLLEDVACLVFLDDVFAGFRRQHDDEKVVGILRKTWAKMSERGRAMALTIPLAEADEALVRRALDGQSGESGQERP